MKVKQDFMIRKILDDYIVVPVGEEMVNFDAMMTLNETGAFLWEQLQEDKTEEELVEALCKEYDINQETAREDVSDFIKLLEQVQVLA